MIRRYRLTKAHKLNGVVQQPGYEFEIPEQTGDWMISGLDVAERVEAPSPVASIDEATFDPFVVVEQPAIAPTPLPRKAQPGCCGNGW